MTTYLFSLPQVCRICYLSNSCIHLRESDLKRQKSSLSCQSTHKLETLKAHVSTHCITPIPSKEFTKSGLWCEHSSVLNEPKINCLAPYAFLNKTSFDLWSLAQKHKTQLTQHCWKNSKQKNLSERSLVILKVPVPSCNSQLVKLLKQWLRLKRRHGANCVQGLHIHGESMANKSCRSP